MERIEIEQVPDEDTRGVYYITNAIHNKYGHIYATYTQWLTDEDSESDDSQEDEVNELGVSDTEASYEDTLQEDEQESNPSAEFRWINFASSHDDIYAFTDSTYHIKRSRFSRKKMQIYHEDEAVCKIIQREETGNIYLKGYTPYILYDVENCLLVFDINYFNSLGPDDEPDDDMILASIAYDLTDNNKNKCVARLEVYENVDLDLMFLYCAACLLIYERIEDHYDKQMASYDPTLASKIRAAGTIAAMNNAAMHRIHMK